MKHSSSSMFFVLPFLKEHEVNEWTLTVYFVSMSQPQCPFNCVGALKSVLFRFSAEFEGSMKCFSGL